MASRDPFRDPRGAPIVKEFPGVLTRLAMVLDSEDPNYDRNLNLLESHVMSSENRAKAFVAVCVILLHSTDVLPGTLRNWAAQMETVELKKWRKANGETR